MKKYLLLLLTIFALNSCEQDPEIIGLDDTAAKKPEQIMICHYNKGNDTWKTIQVNEKQLQRHIDHGDFEGSCEERKTYVPDFGLEYMLFHCGYDDVMDNYVLTSNLSTIVSMELPFDNGPGYITDVSGEVCMTPYATEPEDEYYPNSLTVWDFTGLEDFTNLKRLELGYIQYETFDFAFVESLEWLYVRYSELLNNLILTNNKNLKELRIQECYELTSLELPKSAAFEILFLEKMGKLENIDFKGSPGITSLRFYDGIPLTSLDLSNNPALLDIDINTMLLTRLNLNNKNNRAINSLYVRSANLTCFQVDDAEWSTENWSTSYTYSEDCY